MAIFLRVLEVKRAKAWLIFKHPKFLLDAAVKIDYLTLAFCRSVAQVARVLP